jgi:hypothetical protein
MYGFLSCCDKNSAIIFTRPAACLASTHLETGVPRVLTTANATGISSLMCLPKHGEIQNNKFWSPIPWWSLKTLFSFRDLTLSALPAGPSRDKYINLPLESLNQYKNPHLNPFDTFNNLSIHRDRQQEATLFYTTSMYWFTTTNKWLTPASNSCNSDTSCPAVSALGVRSRKLSNAAAPLSIVSHGMGDPNPIISSSSVL